ncbi:tyrosine-type recombinase/integrase [Paenibacillus radicis (ex Gao et al. 2016)]|uniref:Tyrosine recombinase XerC n=1 Tax=Paenibacillus radicis (ex Gao et al. 2016) TaxID=1737354 RepID=A0A917HLE7_9BACL|nr:tyrosine-type recombinase/integrase [Paenibacillus radicis (ex Gao et al. 2016)]GGG82060.1 tyrosine recombinase XerC [Paenibacillus radicis (ex Gao et al. 2016)]
MLDQYLIEGLRSKSSTTIKTYGHAIEQFEKWLDGAGTNLRDYARSDVQQYIDYLSAKKKSASTINKLWNAIKSYSKWAGKNDTIEDIAIVKVADIKKQAPKAMDKLERNKLIRDIDRTGNKRDFAILMTLLMTGIRVSELVALDRTDVDVSERKGSLIVRLGKGNKERTLPLNVEARRAIEKYLDERIDSHPALFLSNRQDRISIRSVQHLMEKNGHNVHQTRHSFITGLVRAGEDISVIQSLSGHSSADMILRYSMPSEDDKQKAVAHIYKD